MTDEFDVIIVGGGLAGSLTGLALGHLRPETKLLLLDQGSTLGGNHTWSFFDTDVADADRWLVEPLVASRWPGHSVVFPARKRRLSIGYGSITSDSLDNWVRNTLPERAVRTETQVEQVAPHQVRLANGETLRARAVIDARGPRALPGVRLAWQKFVGRAYRFSQPHGLDRPIIMDATVAQHDGFRFVYCLPFDSHTLLVEDTYYSDSPDLDRAVLRQRIDSYVADKGWQVERMSREEEGILPIPLGGSIEALWDNPSLPAVGLAGGFFQPATGYSLPDAVRVAIAISREPDLESAALSRMLRGKSLRLWRQRAFYRLLNRMLFQAADPPTRYAVIEHFYRLDEGLIGRFYAGGLSLVDKSRILSGRPPVSIGRAVRSMIS